MGGVVLCGVLGCGDMSRVHDSSPDPSADLPPCVSCVSADAPSSNTTALPQKLVIEPSELMFYGDPNTPLKPQNITLKNASSSPVVFISAQVLEDPGTVGGEGSAPFFRYQTPPPGSVIKPGEEAVVTVSFLMSTEQKNAWLKIYTSYQAQEVFSVKMSGKYFP